MRKRIVLYCFLVLQLIMSIGVANEFDDYLFAFIFAVLFFVLQIYFLFCISCKKWIAVIVFVITAPHLLNMAMFLNEGTNIISNKWSVENYNATYTFMIFMFIGTLALDAIKIGVIYRGFILKVIKKMFIGFTE